MARLYGAAAIYIGTNANKVSKPLADSEQIRHLTVLTLDDLQVEYYIDDPLSQDFGAPGMYRVGTELVHPSRLCLFTGAEVPGQAFGDSVLYSPYQAIRDADGAASNVATMTYEAKLDVFKIPHLSERLSEPGGEEAIMQRLQTMNMGKSVSNAMVMDGGGDGSEGEQYEQKEISFGGLDEVVLTLYQIAAGAAYIPVTRLLGKSAAGLNSSGDTEIRDYYDLIKTQQSLEITPALASVDRLLLRAVGAAEDTTYEWLPLWQLDEAQQADVGSTNATTIKTLSDTGLFPDDVLYQPSVDLMAAAMPTITESAESFTTGEGDDDENML